MTELHQWIPYRRRTTEDVSGAFTLSGQSVSTPGVVQYVPSSYVLLNQQQGAPNFDELHLAGISSVRDVVAAIDPAVILVKDYLDVFDSVNAAVESFSSSFHVAPFAPYRSLTDAAFWWAGPDPQNASAIRTRDSRLEPFYEKLAQIKSGVWDNTRGARPNDAAIAGTTRALHELKGGPLVPARVLGADERVVLYFKSRKKYANLEFFNAGTAVVVMSDGQGSPRVESFSENELSTVVADIRAYLVR